MSRGDLLDLVSYSKYTIFANYKVSDVQVVN